MYLDYQTYQKMGGTLDNSAFTSLEKRAEYIINAHAGGKTGERIGKLSVLPNEVIDCTYEIVNLLSIAPADGRVVMSESQSLGGQSESYSYSVKSSEQINEEIECAIFVYLYPLKVNGISVLYRGCNED